MTQERARSTWEPVRMKEFPGHPNFSSLALRYESQSGIYIVDCLALDQCLEGIPRSQKFGWRKGRCSLS
jgi:hypothetical protein